MVEPSGLICRRWLVTGRVQGVGFRWFARQAAVSLGLDGTVRNLRQGGVEVVARGSTAELARLEERLRQGPPGARVTSLNGEEAGLPADLTGFQILPTR